MKTLQDLLDREEIRDLRIRYSAYFDGRELDKLMTLFTDDVICEFGPEYGGDWEGHDTIRNNFQSYMDKDSEPWVWLHAVTNHLIELTGPNSARGRCYLLDLNLENANPQPLFLFGVYDDLYQKVNGRWLIHRTRIDFLWPDRYIMDPREE